MADEVRLIDANDYRKRRCRTCINRVQCDNGGNLCFDIMVLNTCPTIEAELVKHGRWETWGYVFHGIAWKRCSVCGKTADVSYQALLDGKIEMATPSICGCCGARLESDNE